MEKIFHLCNSSQLRRLGVDKLETLTNRPQVWGGVCTTKRGLRALVSPPNHTKKDLTHELPIGLTHLN